MVLKIEPGKRPERISMDVTSYEELRAQIGGNIEVVYPFRDNVAIVCDEEGKLKNLQWNRILSYDGNNDFSDILAGTFLVVGITEYDFCDLSEEKLKEYEEYYYDIEEFLVRDNELIVIKY